MASLVSDLSQLLGRARALVSDPTRISAVDRAWLRMDDPTNRMVITGLLLLEGSLSRARLVELVRERIGWIDRLRAHVEPGVLWDRWVESVGHDLEGHVREASLPAPADDAALHAQVSSLVSEGLDPRRPLWELTLLHGLPGGGTGLLARVHHAVGDGFALMLVLLSLTDLEPAPRETSPLRELFRRDGIELERAREFVHELMPQGMKLLLRGASWRGGVQARTRARAVGRAPVLPYRLRDIAAAGASLGSLVLRRPDASTVFRGRLGVPKRVAWSGAVSLSRLQSLRAGIGGTINDIVLTAMTGGLRRYLIERGESPEGVELRAAVPINLRGLDDMASMGNRFGLLFLGLPVGVADPSERLRELRTRMQALEHSAEPLVTSAVLDLIGRGPKLLERSIVAYFAQRVSFVMTNVPGPERPLYLAGRRMTGLLFWAPQSGRVGLGVSICSYDGALRVGVSSDARLVPDPDRIIAGFEAELEAMQARAASDAAAPPE